MSDHEFAITQWRRDRASQFWSRTAIRCLCASIEATLFGFRKMAEQMGSLAGIRFDPEEVEILSETQLRNGVQKPKWLPLADSVKESFRLFGKAAGCPLVVNYSERGFSDLCETFKVRNRLMHPKSTFDVQVSARDIDTADRAIIWLNNSVNGVLDQCRAHTRQKFENLKRHPPR
jgi:hypothetical protein